MFRFSYFSWIRSVLFSFMSGSGLSDLWPHFFVLCPAPVIRIYDPFEFRFVCFVSRSKVKKFDDQACPFFVHVRLRSFRSMHPPTPFILTIFVSFVCAFSHICNDCVVFGSICFVSCLHVLCMYWHSLSSFFCSCPAPAFRIYDPFEFRFVCFVSRSKVKKFDDQVCPFFVHVRLRSFRSMTSFFCSCPAPVFRIYDPPPELYILTIPVLFHIILCCFRSNFGSSVLCPVQR